MSEPFLAEITIVAFNFAPRGYAFCDGQILPINQNQSLYSLLGTTFGGDGRTSFAPPDLRGRTPIHVGASNGTNHPVGQKSGEETHRLSAAEMPQHDHTLRVDSSDRVNTDVPANNTVLGKAGVDTYAAPNNNQKMHLSTVGDAGQGQAHENMQPYLAVNFCIALQGTFPSRN